MYAYFKRLDYFSTECVYAPFAARGAARDFVKDLEARPPARPARRAPGLWEGRAAARTAAAACCVRGAPAPRRTRPKQELLAVRESAGAAV